MVGGGALTSKGFWVARRKMVENSGERIKVGIRVEGGEMEVKRVGST